MVFGLQVPLSEVARQRLERDDFPYHYEHISYPETGHIFPPPFTPAVFSQNRRGFIYGGSIKGTAQAQEDSWQRTLEFLNKVLKDNR